MIKVLAGALCGVGVFALSACGSSAPSAADTATASLKAELLHQSASSASPFTFTDSQAQCTAGRVVSSVGTSALQHYGLLNAENKATAKTLDGTTLSAANATTVVNAIIDCLGSSNVTRSLTDAVSKNILGTRTARQRACLQTKLTVTALKPMLIATLSGNQAASQGFTQSLLSCVTAK